MKYFIIFLFIASIFVGCEKNDDKNSSSVDTEVIGVVEKDKDVIQPTEDDVTNWYIRLVATDLGRSIETRSTILGELEDDTNIDDQQMRRLAPFGTAFIDIAFVNPTDLAEGEYKAYFQTHQEGVSKVWHFSVFSDDINADVVLKWRGFYILTPYLDEDGVTRYRESINRSNPLIKKMQLVDELTGQKVPVINEGQIKAINFNMRNRNKRDFRWELLTTEAVETVANRRASSSLIRSAKRSTVYQEPVQAKSFGFNRPPRFEMR